jgi:type VI secretion system protein ImpH
MAELIELLQQQAPQFQFFQVLRLLERSEENQPNNWFKKTNLLSSSDLTFPAADIKKIQQTSTNQLILYLNFMGLVGVDSPLPHYFSEFLIGQRDTQQLQDFLKIFNQRIYQLLYLAWKKFQPIVQLEQKDYRYYQYLIALSGNCLQMHDKQEFAFAGLFGSSRHTAIGLQQLLQEYLQLPAIEIKQFVPRWLSLDVEEKLGKNLQLGANSVLGQQILSVDSQIEIHIHSLTWEKARQWLPNQTAGQRLTNIIRTYLGKMLNFDLIFHIQVTTPRILKLGCENIQLGWTSWLGMSPGKPYKIQIAN